LSNDAVPLLHPQHFHEAGEANELLVGEFSQRQLGGRLTVALRPVW
jgi:hypothetical protein